MMTISKRTESPAKLFYPKKPRLSIFDTTFVYRATLWYSNLGKKEKISPIVLI